MKVIYEVTSRNLELPEGTRFTVDTEAKLTTDAFTTGALYLFQAGSNLLIGRFFCGCILQPSHVFHIGAVFRCLGQVIILCSL